jgi:hypothetical protein
LVPGRQQLGPIGQSILDAETPVVLITIVKDAVDDPAVDGTVAMLSVSADDPRAVDPVNTVEIQVAPETERVGVLVEGGMIRIRPQPQLRRPSRHAARSVAWPILEPRGPLTQSQSEKPMKKSFKEVLQTLVDDRIAAGEDPRDLFEELLREANLVFGHYNLEYELGLFAKAEDTD